MTGKWAVLTLVALGTFMTALDASIVNINLPSIARTFHAPIGGAVESRSFPQESDTSWQHAVGPGQAAKGPRSRCPGLGAHHSPGQASAGRAK